MFEKFKNKTGVKILITNYINSGDIKTVYDVGNGAFIYDHLGDTPRYLRSGGKFTNPNYRLCNGDAVSWERHIGDVSTLNFKA